MRRSFVTCMLLASCSSESSPTSIKLSADEIRGALRAGLPLHAVATDISIAASADLATLPAARRRIDAALARPLEAECVRNSQGPLTDSELTELTQQHWREVDVGERVKVVHVVALSAKMPTTEGKRAVESIRDELGTATDPAALEAVAAPRARASQGALVFQVLDTITTDGRTAEGAPTTFEPSFVQAAFALSPSAPVSPVFQTSFGWHLAVLLRRLPANRLSEPERRKLFQSEAQTNRARLCVTALLSHLRSDRSPHFAPGFAAEIEKIKQSN